MTLQAKLAAKRFVITAEVTPPTPVDGSVYSTMGGGLILAHRVPGLRGTGGANLKFRVQCIYGV